MDMRDNTKIQGLVIGGLIVAIYGIINLILPRLNIDSFIGAFIIQPVLWGLLAWLSFRASGSLRTTKVRNKSIFVQMAFFIGFMEIMAYCIGGLFSKFGKSPSSFTPTGILGNLFYVGAMLAGMEISRAWLVNKLGRRHSFTAILTVSVLYTLLSQPLSKITGFSLSISSVPNNSAWLPVFGESLLATMLAYLAGWRASLLYRGLLAAFWWFCPILPDLDWTLKTLIGFVVPVLGMMAINSVFNARGIPGKPRKRSQRASFPSSTIIIAIIGVVMIWFATGALPFKPIVVASGSMEPVFYPGDIVVVDKMPASSVKVGEIVEYRNQQEKINIVHRVIDVEGSGNQESFIFKGDANQSPDINPVAPQAIEGRVVFVIPKLGWVSLYIKTFLKG